MVYEPVLYPKLHRWFVALAACDVLLTMSILRVGGSELNPIAAHVISAGQLTGVTFYKFILVALVLIMCEHVGRHSVPLGRRLAACAVSLNCFAVLTGAGQLALWAAFP